MTTSHDKHAVVIGASMAGLFAARVLCDHFERVTLIERDQLPNEPIARKGVPQARHAHILLVRGRQILDHLFPGLVETLVQDGAVLFDSTSDAKQLAFAGWTPRVPAGLHTTSCSRDLLEWRVRERVFQNPRITVLQETDAVGLLAENNFVRGVRLRPRGENHAVQELRSDAVVDASGRSSRATEWLAEFGIPAPPITTINAHLGYASRIFAQPPNATHDWQVLLIQARAPELKRAGAVLPIEGKRWIVTLAGYGRDFPPTDEMGFMEFAKSLAAPDLYDAIRDAEPLNSISGYQRTENQMRHYERVERWLENFFILGDSVSAFNPVYGQGMTNAAQSALTLDKTLREATENAARRFQTALAKQNETPWLLATNEDFRFPTTEGKRPGLSLRFSQWYINQVIKTLVDEPKVFHVFSKVAHLLEPPTALFSPSVIARVIQHSVTRA